jgi:lysophospholipase L1-like esterase
MLKILVAICLFVLCLPSAPSAQFCNGVLCSDFSRVTVSASAAGCLNMTAVGDSITVGYLSTNPWPANIGASIGKTAVNQGVDGIGFNHNPSGTLNGTPSIISEGAGTTDPTRTSNACGSTPPVLIVLAGTNDIGYGSTGAATYGFFQTWISARLADGWPAGDIVVGTILQIDGGTPERAAFNTLLVSGQATYGYKLARLDLDPNIGCNACNTNPAFFNTDGTHPNNTGQQIIANIMCNAMGTGLPCPAAPIITLVLEIFLQQLHGPLRGHTRLLPAGRGSLTYACRSRRWTHAPTCSQTRLGAP